ncbi:MULTISPECIES: iron chelate uptake ABC transporter family permease subunit [Glutamicibacter]|uniref:iron chelate uptake ABC transporter family permease subunit n=1 Tax=Glutamicibacter TaxID=1742989 RepID=UPI00068EB302|nr:MULTISPECIES: iron chelate uptake ABC transporter family permease subunit [Glutamicibacter]KWR69977.1 enterochelin ABC transporter permease [Arthrobacter sp. W1]QEP08569.1 iron chelate uptake ABC transporter family permease subunit [Glutamicibacter sp. ZJUTW]WIV43847.1 iron chelate uptake ABC transporter family permease subunit [Glutamicibacter nicotianae]
MTHPALGTHHAGRSAGPLPTKQVRKRYWITLSIMIGLALFFGIGLLAWDNPMPFGSDGFWIIAKLRASNILTMVIVAACQAIATVAFQTVTNNRIITPSIMGFEALYRVVQTGAVFVLGVAGVTFFTGVSQFVLQVAIMVGLSVALYGWLLSGKLGNIQIMLLVGIIIGTGLGSIATFMQRLLTPSEFDVLTARLFGSMANADMSYMPVAIPLVLIAGGYLVLSSKKMNILALGKETTINLGINHRREVMKSLFFISILMAVTTALVGPLTFLGFLVATLAYQLADTYDHRFIYPMSFLIGFVVLAGAYFIMKNVFYAEGVVGIIIEAVGGITFLIFILRKGRL